MRFCEIERSLKIGLRTTHLPYPPLSESVFRIFSPKQGCILYNQGAILGGDCAERTCLWAFVTG